MKKIFRYTLAFIRKYQITHLVGMIQNLTNPTISHAYLPSSGNSFFVFSASIDVKGRREKTFDPLIAISPEHKRCL